MNKYIEYNWKKYVRFSYLLRHREECINYIWKGLFQTLDEEIIYFLNYKDKKEFIIIPPLFKFDFNSSPTAMHWIVDKDEFCIALIHDYLYSIVTSDRGYTLWVIQSVTDNWIAERTPSRREADKIWFRWAMVENKNIFWRNNYFKTIIGYLWLRLFWWMNWKK